MVKVLIFLFLLILKFYLLPRLSYFDVGALGNAQLALFWETINFCKLAVLIIPVEVVFNG